MGSVLRAMAGRDDIRYRRVGKHWDPLIEGERFDWLLVLGDRHELLAACHTALYRQIPIAHIHGGETTLGSFDDRVRNAVSQLATLHFTAAEMFSDKLRSMKVSGEIFTVGPPGLDDLETDDTSEFGSGFLLVCLHPDTTQRPVYNECMTMALCDALDRFPDRRVVWVGPNGDPGCAAIAGEITRWRPTQRFDYFNALDRRAYLTALKHAAVCIGNSSSFVIEAPALGTPTVLVGDRQKGRPLAATIIEADVSAEGIANGIENRLRYPAFGPLPYGHGGASQKIAEILSTWNA